ncbi:ATP-grasp fold amidoligase family protein [Chengkuizengella axinellae]|uniref:ATP-grasp fold amidoligase family protein n=1 Tax=Chengkuizengella axinellae TaxID=3064388 RepID=A0ABT9IZU6_9BACL|nr:ATP-grasp fold amidoligase family protein [Chengkuizengella sp. 2205SS18-9]MDP5274738.1 ATP-grasp fold amidoligase family protein [Chengkuizengella sp. 2205SS18-9]
MEFYKKVIKDQSMRFKIMRLFNFLPDNAMIKLIYRIKTGRMPNLISPKRYTEKLQWYKLNYHDPLITKCSDKFEVRDYVTSKGYSNILNDLYGVYENVDEIDFDSLPSSFAIKVNDGSGTNIFIQDKASMDIDAVKNQLEIWLRPKKRTVYREWGYYNIKPKIVIEKLLERDSNNDLPDYKFFCFNGKVFCLYTMIDYIDNHANGKLGFYDADFNKMPYRRNDYGEITVNLPKPKNFKKMVEIAEKLSEDFPHVRVDFYNLDGEIIFGELTFYNAGGYTSFIPDEFDFILGEQFVLPKKLR